MFNIYHLHVLHLYTVCIFLYNIFCMDSGIPFILLFIILYTYVWTAWTTYVAQNRDIRKQWRVLTNQYYGIQNCVWCCTQIPTMYINVCSVSVDGGFGTISQLHKNRKRPYWNKSQSGNSNKFYLIDGLEI